MLKIAPELRRELTIFQQKISKNLKFLQRFLRQYKTKPRKKSFYTEIILMVQDIIQWGGIGNAVTVTYAIRNTIVRTKRLRELLLKLQ